MKLHQVVLLVGVSLTTLLTSCEKENIVPRQGHTPSTGTTPGENPNTQPSTDNVPPVHTTPGPVTRNSRITQMGTKVLKYDGQQRLAEVGYTDLAHVGYTVVYEGDKAVRLNYKTGGYLVYAYQGDRITGAVSYYGDNLVNYRYTFAYQGDKLVKQTEMSFARHDEGRLGITQYSYDHSGNLSELAVAWSTSNREEDLSRPSVIKWGNYDTNPYPVPFAESRLYLPGITLFVNNPGFRDPGTGKEIYTYLYHDSGMPRQRYDKLEAYPHVAAFITNYTYE